MSTAREAGRGGRRGEREGERVRLAPAAGIRHVLTRANTPTRFEALQELAAGVPLIVETHLDRCAQLGSAGAPLSAPR